MLLSTILTKSFPLIKYVNKTTKMKKILLSITTTICMSCAPSISSKILNKNYSKLGEESKIYVLEQNDTIPTNSELIGDIKVGDSGFSTDCGYNKALSEITNLAKNSGANIIKILEVKAPNLLGSSCYRIKARIYRNLNPEVLVKLSNINNETNKSRLPENADFAVIYFYRPSNGIGALLGYKIKNENDSIIGRVRNGEKFEYKTKKFGNQTFFGELETKEKIIINVEKGKEYFVRCGVTMGVALGRPEIYLIENRIGIKEYEQMK